MGLNKTLLIISIISTLLIVFSKYLLVNVNIIGWQLSALGCLMIAIYNYYKKIHVLAVIAFGQFFLSLYGRYKWGIIQGLQLVDYIIISLTLLFALYITKIEYESGDKYRFSQLIALLCVIAGFVLVGLSIGLGRKVFFVGHIFMSYVYHGKKAYRYAGMQLLSAYIALSEFTPLPLPY